MRILACADQHGHADRIARVRALVTEYTPNVLLLPGDLTHVGRGEEALDLLGTLSIPVLAVPGNMDGPRALAEIHSRGGLSGDQPVIIEGVSFGGPRAGAPCDVLVTHEPPYGTLDTVPSGQHIGSRSVQEQIARVHPRLLTCGHVHESPGVERIGDTVVVNCTMGDGKTGGALIELTPQDVRARLL